MEQESSTHNEDTNGDGTGEKEGAVVVDNNSNMPEEAHLTDDQLAASDNTENGDQRVQDGDEGEDEGNNNDQSVKTEQSKITFARPRKSLSDREILFIKKEDRRKREEFNPEDFPPSYRQNDSREDLVLKYAENFRSQYIHLYRDRKPLLLAPINECGIEKFVCTTVRRTFLPFPEFLDWDKAASFVADYLICEMLQPPFELPEQILSPATILKRQKGNCFEYSILLCSLLLGAGYDAYVVSGYATQEVCSAEQVQQICPFLVKKEEVHQVEQVKNIKKYTVKPPKDLTSKFEKKQLSRKKMEEEEAVRKQRLAEEEAELALLPKPTDDSLYGMRIHSWILVKSGKREVAESFFIEPFTGLPEALLNEKYLGIESIWNSQNYWVNMQDCSNGVKDMFFDLGDCAKWEYMFPTEEEIDTEFEDEADKNEDVEKHLDMPNSWVEPLEISVNDFQKRYPGGKKIIYYKKSKLEKFSQYLMPNALVNRVSVYDDIERTNLVRVYEYYLNRVDKLHKREYDHQKGWVHEYFHEGRAKHLKEHMYKFNTITPESERTMLFYHNARVDELEKRVEMPTEMTEHFVGREDFLFYRYTEFGKRQNIFAPKNMTETEQGRPILKIIEKFHRNREKVANDDVFMRTFTGNKINIVYHTDDKCISYSTRDFQKSPTWTDTNAPSIGWEPELHTSFQVGPAGSIQKEVDVYLFLRQMLNEEVQSRDAVRKSELEVKAILNERMFEEALVKVDVSIYDTRRNEKAKARRQKMKEREEEQRRREAMEIDYLAPFCAQISNPEKLSKLEASTVHKACLEDLRNRFLERANFSQKRFEKETEDLLKKQEWYQKNQVSMQEQDEDEYIKYVDESLFRIGVVERQLNRQKELATRTYKATERKLRNDPRLSELFN